MSAVLGGAAAPVLMIDAMVDEFEEITRVANLESLRQRKKWRQPKETALGVFDLVGFPSRR